VLTAAELVTEAKKRVENLTDPPWVRWRLR